MGPGREMLIFPQRRLLIEGGGAELLLGEDEKPVSGRHLTRKPGISRVFSANGPSDIHLLFDRHEIVQSEGIWTESFQLVERMLTEMDKAARDEMLALCPDIAGRGGLCPAARLSPKAHEARVLLAPRRPSNSTAAAELGAS